MKIHHGFTLIELMITVAVIAILATIALPSYQESIAKARRSDAQGALYGLANAMQRFFTEHNTFCGAETGGTAGTCAAGSPRIYSANVPGSGGSSYYNMTISAVTQTSYTLTATRSGSMTDDKCGNFTLTNIGVRGLVSNSHPASLCWR
ncbi:MAG: prepilin-type N-terminal cleavage/methylation domain-containing protein [gamma proteobacterium symbiont of Taylorina sp.]|nr:prepilin-type N-terminal cleavage/methylation domain-containing protein [gamma proteobacterium symbiont of Taylorina sp.]